MASFTGLQSSFLQLADLPHFRHTWVGLSTNERNLPKSFLSVFFSSQSGFDMNGPSLVDNESQLRLVYANLEMMSTGAIVMITPL